MKIWLVEIKEVKRNALTGVFERTHVLAENVDTALIKVETYFKKEYKGIELEVTKIEELFEVDELK